ncbi:MAG: hypothetical protein IPK12_04415 [Gemmatimonadetes bacterium]|nr:hypothetical protein [Gemmatimonadota bacterium]
MKIPRSRTPVALLLLAFVLGGYGLPLFDAIVFHGQPGSQRVAERHLSDGEDARTHVQVCHLGDGAAPERALASAAVRPEFAPISTLMQVSVLDARFVTASDLALPPSRGPPAA